LKNAITYTSSQKLLSKSAFNTCGNFVVVTKQEILVISLTLFFDIASWLHNDVILTSVSVYLFTTPSLFKNGALLTHATVELLRQETPNIIAPNLWPTNNPDLNRVYYEIWAVMQHRVYHRQIHSVDELKRRLTDVWCMHAVLNSRFFTRLLIDQWRGRLRVCVRAKGVHCGQLMNW